MLNNQVIDFPSLLDYQGLCDTTSTPRFFNPACKCPTYAGNLGPCKTYEEGGNGRCVYCDHEAVCHSIE